MCSIFFCVVDKSVWLAWFGLAAETIHREYNVKYPTSLTTIPEDSSLSCLGVDEFPDPPPPTGKVHPVVGDVVVHVSQPGILPPLLDSFLPLTLQRSEHKDN